MNDFASSSCHDRIADFKITQVQRDSHFDMGESHYHPYYEFYYLLSGQCRCFISHSIYRLFPGDLIMIPPSVLHTHHSVFQPSAVRTPDDASAP